MIEQALIVDLLDEVRKHPSYSTYERLGGKLAGVDGSTVVAENRTVKVSVLCSFTIDPIKAYLQIDCLERGIWADVYIPAFNQFQQEILSADSKLYAFAPDISFLHIQPEALLAGAAAGRLSEDQVEPLIGGVRELIYTFRERSDADFVVSNFAYPDRFPNSLTNREMVGVYRRANDRLAQVAEEISGVQILDYEGLTAFYGKASVADARLQHIARMDVGNKFLPRLATKMQAHLLAARGLGRKCIVVDLDNTLWGGVIGEDGVDGIQLGSEFPGSAFVEFQRSLLAIERRGVLLAINSKNNEGDARRVLEKHPAMILRPPQFAATRINWLDKCQNIESIAAELNLGLESMVFVDDNPAERELVRKLRPEVLTPEWPSDPVEYRSAIEALPDFETTRMTDEDRRRGTMYAGEKDRDHFKGRSASLESYLYGLEMKMFVNECDATDIPRVQQLLNKTNQFNLTTRRYSVAEVKKLREQSDVILYVMRNQDAFGDNGLVGIALAFQDDDTTWVIDSFLMSCRVLGRTVEQGFLNCILEDLESRGGRLVVGKYIPSAKNELVQEFYADAGFVEINSDDEGQRWALTLGSLAAPVLPWLAINPER